MTQRKTAIIIGAGIGGLLSAAVLCRHGYEVIVVERLGFPGGRFTSFSYQGFEVPSGAFHMLPGGRRGQLFAALEALGIAPTLHVPQWGLIVRSRGNTWPLSQSPFRRGSFLSRLPLRDRIAAVRLVLALRRPNRLSDLAIGTYLARIGAGPLLIGLLDKLMQFANGVTIQEASLLEAARSLAAQGWSKEGIIVGGCRAVILRLVELIEAAGGKLLLGDGASAIEVRPGEGFVVSTESGRFLRGDIVVSNAGPKETVRLLGPLSPAWLRDKTERLAPTSSAAYSVRSRAPLVEHSAIEFPLDAAHIAGYLQVSNADPGLAPAGWHYLLAYQHLAADDLPSQLEGGLADLRALFPAIQPQDVFNVSVYRGAWPGARTAPRVGQHGDQRYPVAISDLPGLFMVGEDAQGYGFAAEIIGGAVRALDRKLGGRVFGAVPVPRLAGTLAETRD